MTRLHLTIHNDDDLRKILKFLEEFDKKEVQIDTSDTSMVSDSAVDYLSKVDNPDESEEYVPVPDDPVFLANKRYLECEWEEVKSGKAIFYTLEEVEKVLDETLAKYESGF